MKNGVILDLDNINWWYVCLNNKPSCIDEELYYKTLEDAINEIDGSLRSCCTYIGCTKMKTFNRHVTFYKVHKQFNAIYEKCENING